MLYLKHSLPVELCVASVCPAWGNRKAVERSYAALSSFEVREPGAIINPNLHLDQTNTQIIVLPAKAEAELAEAHAASDKGG